MNYAQARQNQKSKYWDWTTQNDGQIWRSKPCELSCSHKTAEEAEYHFYLYCLEQARIHEHPNEQHKCEICERWATKTFGNNQMWLIIRPVDLCGEHATKEFLQQVEPFSPGYSLIHS